MVLFTTIFISVVIIGVCLHLRHVTRLKYTLQALQYARHKREEAYLLDMIENQRGRMRKALQEENENDDNL